MFYDVLPKAPIIIDAATADATNQSGYQRVVSLVDPSGTTKWVFYFLINSSGHLGFHKSVNNGTSFGSFQTIDSSPADYTNVAVWYDRWTQGGTGNIIHVVGSNTTDQGLRYFQIDTDNSDAVSVDVKALSSTTIVSNSRCSICISFDGTIYVAATFTTSAGIRMADSGDSGATWNDRGLITNSSNAADGGKLVPAKTDDDIMMYMRANGVADFDVMRWDAVGLSWATEDSTTIPFTVGINNFDVIHEPTNGDSYVITVDVAGTLSTLAELKTYFYDESAGGSVTLQGTTKLMNNSATSNVVGHPKLILDTNNNTLACMYFWGTGTSSVPQTMLSFDDGKSFGDPTRVNLNLNSDDNRYSTTSYHVIDDTLGMHLGWMNDDLDDALYNTYILDRITGNVVDNSDVAAANVDVLIFSVSPDNSLNRTYQGRAISDGSGNWAASVLDVGDDNIEIQIIYDEDLTNDEVDASHRLAVDSF